MTHQHTPHQPLSSVVSMVKSSQSLLINSAYFTFPADYNFVENVFSPFLCES